jgi:hypothetical protein
VREISRLIYWRPNLPTSEPTSLQMRANNVHIRVVPCVTARNEPNPPEETLHTKGSCVSLELAAAVSCSLWAHSSPFVLWRKAQAMIHLPRHLTTENATESASNLNQTVCRKQMLIHHTSVYYRTWDMRTRHTHWHWPAETILENRMTKKKRNAINAQLTHKQIWPTWLVKLAS